MTIGALFNLSSRVYDRLYCCAHCLEVECHSDVANVIHPSVPEYEVLGPLKIREISKLR
jgi:hypothetical protein